ncbi:MAG: thiamine pyrophosphate-dependent enzyme, partial [Chitinispirillaceae bacterium]|nr:thiamine pyrophosphate-dependent enzyme [Chitinispirillaceae bacterium]
ETEYRQLRLIERETRTKIARLQLPTRVQTVEEQRENLKQKLANRTDLESRMLLGVADYLVRKSVWIIGGDGWAYDIGYGGLDHVLASGRNVNVLVLDTEVYSNTGGQSSKSTPMGAVAKFAAGGKPTTKKDLGLMAMTYGYVYVASIALGANQNQAIKAIVEAESYDGPSLIICYSHCINHGIDMVKGNYNQKLAVESGHWPLYRYNPALAEEGKNPLIIDSKEPTIPLSEYVYKENRYRILQRANPEVSAKLIEESEKRIKARFNLLKAMASIQQS